MYVSDRAMPSEDSLIQAIETMLQITTIGNKSEESFVMDGVGADGLCTDPEFAPGVTSLYPDPAQPPASAVSNISWRRVSGTLYLPTGKTPKLLQGIMNNQHFLGAVAAVAVKQDLLLDLIVSDDHAEQGVYTFQFYKHGCWHQVSIDNYLPCLDTEDRLAFACSGNVGELWPSFLEKAYAKLHGSYFALEGGSILDVLTDLTGGVAHKIKLDTEQGEMDVTTGLVWDQICELLASGGVMACQARHPGDSDSAGPSGLLKNLVYNVMDARQLDDGTRLLRVHCPWPSGLWHGPWSAGSYEWSAPAAQPLMPLFAATMQDDATFWISYRDFTSFFTRLYACRLFPPTWHQLTLHCGWQGASAGGPYYAQVGQKDGEAMMSMSSTWCCNPQFRITVRKTCDIFVCLGQQDPLVANRRHVRKALRRRTIGMQVLRIPLSALGRRWEVRGNELMQEVALTASREAMAVFRAEPGYAYVAVPYAGRAGDEGAFVLRVFSSSPLEVEQLPSPLSLVLGGQWVGFLAGGSRKHTTFGSNPQYMISTQHRTQVVLCVSRLDVRYAIIKPQYNPEQCVGLLLLEPEKAGPDGGLGRRSAVRNESEVYAQAECSNMEEAVMLVTLEPETPYVLVPCLATAGIEAPFELRIMSGVPVELVPLPEVKCMVLQGEWHEENSGGCDLNPTWKKNPRYLLALSKNGKARITLNRLGKALKKTSSVDDMMGFHVLRASEANGEIRGDLRRAVVADTTYVTTAENSAQFDLQAGIPYIVIPSKYSPGRVGRFTLGVTCSEDFDFMEL